MRNLVEGEEKFEDQLRGYTYFFAVVYLIVQPYVLGYPSVDLQESSNSPFSEIIFVGIIIFLFSLAYLFCERKSGLNLDQFLNFFIPYIITATIVSVSFDLFAVVWFESHGISQQEIYTRCTGFDDYPCTEQLFKIPTLVPYIFAISTRAAEGHFMSLFLLLYSLGLDPLRVKKYAEFEKEWHKWIIVVMVYIFLQGFLLRKFWLEKIFP